MKRHLLLLLALLGLVAIVRAENNANWSKLKAGMSQDEAYAILGKPLVRTSGKGYEVWIYNSQAEVVFVQGPVYAWTEPSPQIGDESHPIEQDLPLMPKLRLPIRRTPALTPMNQPDGDADAANTTHFRYKDRM